MRVLVIGNADSVWVKSLIDKTLLSYGDSVSVLSPKNSIYRAYYEDNDVEIYTIKRVGCALFFINIIRNISFICRKYDIITIQYTERWNAFWGVIGSFFSNKLVVSFWGSDLLRQKKHNRFILNAIKRASAVTLTTNEMANKFIALYGGSYKDKIRMTKFGSNGIDYLNREFDIKKILEQYAICENKVVVSIGYNRMREQQHLAVLAVINSLSGELRKKIHLILRLTYGTGDSEYVRHIKKLADKSCCSYTIFEEYLSDTKVAEITAITDVFIHAQTTDARSASMSEHLYAKCIVINPSWIKYPDFEGKAFYLTFKDFDDLQAVLIDNLVKKEQSRYRDLLLNNVKVIDHYCSWSTVTPFWRHVYEGSE